MNFDELKGFLEKRLQKELPGGIAHELMKPRLPDGSPLRLKNSKPPKEGGVLILFYENDKKANFPLIQRPKYEGIHGGQMALPGGKYEKGDDDLVMTALRETREEIGVPEEKIEVIGSLSTFFVAASNYIVKPVVGVIHEHPIFVPDPREVEEIITPSIDQLIDSTLLKEKELIVRNGYKLQCPYFDLEGRVVWGATAMMLSELVVILKEEFTS
jgi:8-oxo-dGTP pyrophosphatase MutT (NUDIX family)